MENVNSSNAREDVETIQFKTKCLEHQVGLWVPTSIFFSPGWGSISEYLCITDFIVWHVIKVTSVVKRVLCADVDDQLEEERCSTLKATIDLLGEALALQCMLMNKLCHVDESKKEELQNLLTEVNNMESQLKTEEGR